MEQKCPLWGSKLEDVVKKRLFIEQKIGERRKEDILALCSPKPRFLVPIQKLIRYQ